MPRADLCGVLSSLAEEEEVEDAIDAFVAADGEVIATASHVTTYDAVATLPVDYYQNIKSVNIELGEGRLLSFKSVGFYRGRTTVHVFTTGGTLALYAEEDEISFEPNPEYAEYFPYSVSPMRKLLTIGGTATFTVDDTATVCL